MKRWWWWNENDTLESYAYIYTHTRSFFENYPSIHVLYTLYSILCCMNKKGSSNSYCAIPSPHYHHHQQHTYIYLFIIILSFFARCMCSICSGQVRDTGFAAALRIDKNIIKEHTYTDKRTETEQQQQSISSSNSKEKSNLYT